MNSGAVLTADGTLGLNINDENNDWVDLPDGILSNAENFTVAMWVNPEETREWARLFDFGTSSNNGYMMFCPSDSNGKTTYAITQTTYTAEQNVSIEPIREGEWSHIAVTQDGDKVGVYINGKAAVETTMTLALKNSIGENAKHYIGRSQYEADPKFKGEVMDLRINDKALTADNIAEMMKAYDPTPVESVSINKNFTALYSYTDDNA